MIVLYYECRNCPEMFEKKWSDLHQAQNELTLSGVTFVSTFETAYHFCCEDERGKRYGRGDLIAIEEREEEERGCP